MEVKVPKQGDSARCARGLTEIESDLAKAEAAFADADTRLRDAERDRNAALDKIDRHQTEFDEAVSQLRRRSVAGSRWQRESASPADRAGEGSERPLMLKPEDIAEDRAEDLVEDKPAVIRPRLASVSDEFDRLKVLVQTTGKRPSH